MEYSFDLKIPGDRIAVVIGKNGATKNELEKLTKAKIQVDSKEGDIVIEGDDPILLYALREILKGIARGFSPEIARLLLKQDFVLEIIPLSDYVKQKTHMQRIKGRVIGADGKSRERIEELSECHISVYGKTISILGRTDHIWLAKKSIQMLLSGSTHSTVYRWLERQRRELMKSELEG